MKKLPKCKSCEYCNRVQPKWNMEVRFCKYGMDGMQKFFQDGKWIENKDYNSGSPKWCELRVTKY